MQTDFQTKTCKQLAQIDTMKQTVDSTVTRLNELKNLDRSFMNTAIHTRSMTPEITLIAKNNIQEPSEDILAIASEIMNSINDSENVVAATRLKSKE